MFLKPKKQYYLDIALLLFGLVSILTGMALSIKPPALMPYLRAMNVKSLHEWASYALTVFVILHVVFHMDWIKAMTKNTINPKNNA